MIGKLAGVAWVLLGTAVLAQSQFRGMRIDASPPAATAIECRLGRYTENGRANPAEDAICRPPSLAATGIAISVAESSYAYVENPPCPGGNTDGVTLGLARTLLGITTGTLQSLDQVQRRASLLGRDAWALAMGVPQDKMSRCQLFVVRTPVRAGAIRAIEFRAHQNQRSDIRQCFETSVTPTPSGTFQLTQTQGGCAINWSAWQSATVLDDPRGGAIVAGVFKNWSHDRKRVGQLWVWYGTNAP